MNLELEAERHNHQKDNEYLVGELNRLRAEIERLRTALTRIAVWDDVGANEHLVATGSYGRFDEPGSVQIARETLSYEQKADDHEG